MFTATPSVFRRISASLDSMLNSITQRRRWVPLLSNDDSMARHDNEALSDSSPRHSYVNTTTAVVTPTPPIQISIFGADSRLLFRGVDQRPFKIGGGGGYYGTAVDAFIAPTMSMICRVGSGGYRGTIHAKEA